ncbi:MAG: DUF1330 domain-containing protein [Acidimicrobiia bacterium]|nr:MAG: DUF1330 domain-containing protein [Acidimicrobiia bacterium]
MRAVGITHPYTGPMHISPTQEAIAAFIARDIPGPLKMLNLLRFRDTADYSEYPDLAPDGSLTGEEAYDLYGAAVLPLLDSFGAKPILMGTGGSLLIGPEDAQWDRVLVVEYPSVAKFLEFIQSPDYQAVSGHRTAALADSRLLPIE